MRTALLSALKLTDTGELRAGLMLGGLSVLERQGLLLALALGCERIVCLCDARSPAILALQRQVESGGKEFHAVRGTLQIVSLIRADDELVMMLDGLLPDPALVLGFAGRNDIGSDRIEKAIATLPTAHSLVDRWPDDFERIDRERHWAGLAIMRGNHVQKLADLPPDGDAMSLLLRLALQSQTECRGMEILAAESDCWIVASSSDALARRERSQIDRFANVPPWTGPGRALAATLVRRIVPRWLAKGPQIAGMIAGSLLFFGALLASLGYGAAGLAVAAMGAFSGSFGQKWDDLRARLRSLDQTGGSSWFAKLQTASEVAAALTLILALSLDPERAAPIDLTRVNLSTVALPVLALWAAAQAAKGLDLRSAAFWRDRSLHLALFAAASAGGYLAEVTALFGLGAMAQLMLRGVR